MHPLKECGNKNQTFYRGQAALLGAAVYDAPFSTAQIMLEFSWSSETREFHNASGVATGMPSRLQQSAFQLRNEFTGRRIREHWSSSAIFLAR